MKQSLSGPEHTVRQLFDSHFHQLVISAFRYVNDYQQAEDIVQDVFVKVWQQFDVFEPVENKKSYLFAAVKNSCLNYLRHLKVQQRFSADAGETLMAAEKSPEDHKTGEEDRHRIHTAVSRLPDPWREAFVRSKYDSLKYHEIAGEMRISQKTVEKYISKALQFLRHELRDLLAGILILIFLIVKNIFPNL